VISPGEHLDGTAPGTSAISSSDVFATVTLVILDGGHPVFPPSN
jgi:hypothetical protein